MPPSEQDHPARVLLVDDDAQITRSLGQWLELSEFSVRVAHSVTEADAAFEESPAFDVVISDVRMPGRDGIDFLRALRKRDPAMPVVMLSGHADVPMAVEALKAGAFDFLTKPADPERLVAILRNAVAQNRLRRRVEALEAQLVVSESLDSRLIGHSPAMAALRTEITTLAGLPLDVIVTGETGAGKEVVAAALHAFGPRRNGRFVAVNCAAIPEEIFESELFGHESGAFTGARQTRVGKLEYASGGTLLLDEIESMPLAAQGKILRALQERVVERLGTNRSIPIDLRVVAATKINLREAASAGRFRADLYYRLAGVEIQIPPLRARGEDITLLFAVFAARMAEKSGLPAPVLTSEQHQALRAHSWPGNVRELRTVAERFALGLGLGLTTPGLPAEAEGHQPDVPEIDGLADRVAAYEADLIREALQAAKGSISAVVDRLKIPRRTLNEKMQRYGIRRDEGSA
jgi:two-component system, NtrC family, C4-dicarboxylate transport response regulator DctD